MTSTALALLRAVVEHPGEDMPRLVYADWLSENDGEEPCHAEGCGNPAPGWVEFYQCRDCKGRGQVPNRFAERAEFVRVQCELASLPEEIHANRLMHQIEWDSLRHKPNGWRFELSAPQDRIGVLHYTISNPALKELRRRERELLEAFGPQWCPVLNGDKGPFLKQCCIDNIDPPPLSCPVRVRFTRGFPSSITCSWQSWLTIAPAVCWPMHECPKCANGANLSSREWLNSPINPCPACRGRGVVPGAVECENCGGDGEITPRNSGHSSCSPCPDCGGKWNSGPFLHDDDPYTKGTGRIPREFLPTMLPLETVTLTNWPTYHLRRGNLAGGGDLYLSIEGKEHIVPTLATAAERGQAWLAAEYGSRIRFVLPGEA